MSERNGDKARFQKNRKRRLHQRQRTRTLMGIVRRTTDNDASRVTTARESTRSGG